jgi:dihydrofolate reductase
LTLIIIAAVSLNRVIGKDGKVPWDIPEDLQRFMRLTTGHTVLMGRRSFESLGNPLPRRRNVVLSSMPIAGIETYQSLDAAFSALKDQDKVFVIGGGVVFRELIDKADLLQLTIVERRVLGDTFFPPYEDLVKNEMELVFEERHEGFRYVDYSRRGRL